MRDLYDVELKEGREEGKWRLKNHVFDIALPWADGLTACEVCTAMLSMKPNISVVQQEEHRRAYSDVVVVNCPNNRYIARGE